MSVFEVFFQVVGLTVVLITAFAWRLGTPRTISTIWTWLAALGRHHGWSIVAVGTVSLLLSVSVSALRMPRPEVHDEFSYLLAADTFAQGRLTNPTHAFWRHFESIHIIHQPSYMSKYPPANGLLLAAGQITTGYPLVGVWMGTALAAAGLCWMLQGWVPGRWALLGGLIAVFHPKLQLYWGQTYWGGSVALLGGALLLGSYPRLLRHSTLRDGLIMGIGLGVLANSRPFEGLVAGLIVLVGLSWNRIRGGGISVWHLARRVAFPVLIVLVPVGGAMLLYNHRVTGNPLTMPYQVHERTYMPVPLFLWQPPRQVPPYRHAAMASFYARTLEVYHSQKPLTSALLQRVRVAVGLWLFFVGIVLTVTVVPLLRGVGRRSVRFAVACLMIALGVSCLGVWLQPHYLAPVVPLVVLLLVEGLRYLRVYRPARRAVGPILVTGLLLVYFSAFAVAAVVHVRRPASWVQHREQMAERLQQLPGSHLVMVKYGQHHNPLHEWIYNPADIDGSEIIWARLMSPEEDQRLFDHFGDRRVWLLDMAGPTARIEEIRRSEP